MKLDIVILAAGQGTRMRSALPKVLHPLGGRPLLQHVIDTAASLQPDAIHVVFGHAGEQVRAALAECAVNWVEQTQQLGTGHAVDQVMPAIGDDGVVLVLYGDVPLISAPSLQAMVGQARAGKLSVLTAVLADPGGYGRMLRGADGRLTGIVEHRDASEAQRAICEINTGFLAAPARLLRGWLHSLDNNNVQGEYYLTDVVAMAAAQGVSVESAAAGAEYEILGVNDRVQLAGLERVYQRRCAEQLMRAGVTLADPARIDVRGALQAGCDSFIDVNAVFEGQVSLGSGVHIGPNCYIRDSHIGDGTQVFANSVIDAARIGAGARIGPFARIRPDTELADEVHIGNFVEVKKSSIGRGSKVNHLSYIGDTRMGADVNVGAGTITCNYDGANKHLTEIGNDVFIGSDTQLVAPVKVGDGATIGAGTTVTREVPAGELALSRCPQKSIAGWQRPRKRTPGS
jgi:bifunctional UDP-N-acetylglucosamine pyrophosphorylase/glucosamine-1-phosphate N-acetyltransferase